MVARFWQASMILILLVGGFEAVGKQKARFGRQCYIYVEPNLSSKKKCHRTSGDRVQSVKMVDSQFFEVTSGSCKGYVPNSCLSFKKKGRRKNYKVDTAIKLHRFRFGFALEGQRLWGRVSGADSGSGGWGFGSAFLLTMPLGRHVQISLKPSYQVLSLTQTIDGTGTIEDSSPSEFTHRIPHAGVGLFFQYLIRSSYGYSMSMSEPDWWFDVGLEYLLPLSAKQIDSQGVETPFSTTDKPFLVSLGTSGDFFLSSNFSLIASIQGYYNLSARAGSRILGVRLALGMSYSI